MSETTTPTNEPAKKRGMFQIHLSTCVILMFVAGGLLWANTRVYGTYDAAYVESALPLPGGPAKEIAERVDYGIGWPLLHTERHDGRWHFPIPGDPGTTATSNFVDGNRVAAALNALGLEEFEHKYRNGTHPSFQEIVGSPETKLRWLPAVADAAVSLIILLAVAALCERLTFLLQLMPLFGP